MGVLGRRGRLLTSIRKKKKKRKRWLPLNVKAVDRRQLERRLVDYPWWSRVVVSDGGGPVAGSGGGSQSVVITHGDDTGWDC